MINLLPGPGRGQALVDLRERPHGDQLGARAEAGRLADVCLDVDPAPITRLFLDRMHGRG